MSTVVELTSLINDKGAHIKKLKADKAPAEEVQREVNGLLDLKKRYQEANGGVPFDPPKANKEKDKEKEKAVSGGGEAVAREGPSKKELNKLARKEKAANWKAGASSSTEGGSADARAGDPIVRVQCSMKSIPEVSRITSALLGLHVSFDALPATMDIYQPFIHDLVEGSISGDINVARYLARSGVASLYGAGNKWHEAQIDSWLEYFTNGDPTALPPILNSHLKERTFLVGATVSLADLALYHQLTKNRLSVSESVTPHMKRWMDLISSHMPQKLPAVNAPKGGKGAVTTMGASVSGQDAEVDGGDVCPHLEGAVDGHFCSRFPPEPSGYLHIGHAKAVLLNQYYAQRYHGRLLVRFDDTNPSKEKEEYEENIKKDLVTLQVKADQISHTSDHFAKCEELARKMILEGKAYMDDTDQEKMQKERLAFINSYRRDTLPEENLRLFEAMLLGKRDTSKGEVDATKFCLRAKIDMQSPNGTLRDPVLYRFNDTPHHRTGSKYKGYPTYDFACPVVDSIEGVTHALRTTEYNDRDEQYRWLQEAMGLRKVIIHSFENKIVEGWFDPRFPTIQGCLRRGVNIDALKSFIISQGASRRVITMEWDKFWSENKKILEDTAPRYMAVQKNTCIPFFVTNLNSEISIASISVHPQKPEMGTRVSRRFNRILLDLDDVLTLKDGEEVTLLRWGNFNIDKIEKDSSGKILSISGRYNPDATNFSKTKKLSWLSDVPDIVPCKLVEFDHLISKAKLEEDDNFQDFVNPTTRFESEALADACLRLVRPGDVIQLERKGFFRCDEAYGGSSLKPIVLFYIPDGKLKPSPSAVAAAAAAALGSTK